MVPSSQLTLFRAPGDEGELLLTNKTEDQLTSRLLWPFVICAVLGTIGFILGIGGAVSEVL